MEIEELDLLMELASYAHDPFAFVMWAFPWGEAGTTLADRRGPEPWQRELLDSVANGLKVDEAIRQATMSGNGVGKSAVVAWLILWAHATREDTRGVVTANTEAQLKTKTWAELGKWFHLFIAKQFFHLEATSLFSRDPDHKLTWRTDMIPWSERNVAAFQGLHNEGKRQFIVFDEASGIPDGIWEAAAGCMTDAGTERIWAVFGNPNNPTGRFVECFDEGRHAHDWTSRHVDSRTEDSDYVRVRVLGVPPRVAALGFISPELANAAEKRFVDAERLEPLVIGVDVARFGDDATVILFRRGRDAKSLPPIILRGVDTMGVAAQVARAYENFHPDAVFVDGGGVGGGVVDRLRQLRIPVFEVQFGAKADFHNADDGVKYGNKRTEIWGAVRSWISGGAIPEGIGLAAELSAPTYSFNARGELMLESKDEMRRRGVASPDVADALACTFAYSVALDKTLTSGPDKWDALAHGGRNFIQSEYDPVQREFT
jgi:hypothetical protein